MLIDTHSHLYLPQFDDDRQAMLERAKSAGVEKILLPNIDSDSIGPMLALCQSHPDLCIPMMGLHPCDVKENFREVLVEMRAHFNTGNYIAVGEIGIDLYWDKTIFAVVDRLHDEHLKGVFHCFTGTADQARKIMEYGNFYMGIGGVLSYEKSGLDAVVKDIPLHYLMLETDSPFLAPKPYRGKRNESAYVKFVAEKLADIKGISLKEVARATSDNADTLFGWRNFQTSTNP